MEWYSKLLEVGDPEEQEEAEHRLMDLNDSDSHRLWHINPFAEPGMLGAANIVNNIFL